MSVLRNLNIFSGYNRQLHKEFDRGFYLNEYPDVVESGMDPMEHYMSIGWKEGRDPSPRFNTSYYLDRYQDVAQAGINPFLHYLKNGRDEGRFGKPVETEMSSELSQRDVNETSDHIPPREELRKLYFDFDWYCSKYGLQFASIDEGLQHYLDDGWALGNDPNYYFSTTGYLDLYGAQIAPNQCPLEHFVDNHYNQYLQISDRFSSRYYNSVYPEVVEAGYPAFYHFMRWGLAEQRRPCPPPAWRDPYFDEGRLIDDIEEAYASAPTADWEPEVSVIIPVYNQCSYTLRCVWSIIKASDPVKLEIIIADDCSSDETQSIFEPLKGIKYIRNPENLGFLRSCNRAAGFATAPYLYFLNNDTAVLPGWMSSLLDTFDRFPAVGLVGSKLLYPNGTLQEAGGIVWQDASGANVGRWGDPDRPEWNYVRDVNYVSGAAILVKRDVWEALDGFDDRYAPAYYEDTDLCFTIRAAGLRVMYQPGSRVVHFEGVSCGTDLGSGIKSYQVKNSKKFNEKWAHALGSHFPSADVNRENSSSTRRPRMLVVDAVTPRPDHDAGAVISFHLLELFIELGYDVTFAPYNLLEDGVYTENLQKIGIECLSRPYVNNLQEYIRLHGREFDVFFMHRVNEGGIIANYLKSIYPEIPTIFHTQDLHYLREERAAKLDNSEEKMKIAQDTKVREQKLMSICDSTILVSKEELKILENEPFIQKLKVIPLVFSKPKRTSKKSFDERDGIVFVGGYQHTPNVDAVVYFVEKVWPLIIKQRPELRFYIVGSRPPKEVRDLASDSVIFKGYVKDLDEFYENQRISVAPLRYGAGIKGKIGSALLVGVPVVASKIAVEGMDIDQSEGVIVADEPEHMAASIIKLHDDKALWEKLSEAGQAFVDREYSMDATKTRLMELFSGVGATPLVESLCPFTGQAEKLNLKNRMQVDSLVAPGSGARTSDRMLARSALEQINRAINSDLKSFSAPAFKSLCEDNSDLAELPRFHLVGDLPLLEEHLGPLMMERGDDVGPVVALVRIDVSNYTTINKLMTAKGLWDWHEDSNISAAAIIVVGATKENIVEFRTAIYRKITEDGWRCTADAVAAPEHAIVNCVLYSAIPRQGNRS